MSIRRQRTAYKTTLSAAVALGLSPLVSLGTNAQVATGDADDNVIEEITVTARRSAETR